METKKRKLYKQYDIYIMLYNKKNIPHRFAIGWKIGFHTVTWRIYTSHAACAMHMWLTNHWLKHVHRKLIAIIQHVFNYMVATTYPTLTCNSVKKPTDQPRHRQHTSNDCTMRSSGACMQSIQSVALLGHPWTWHHKPFDPNRPTGSTTCTLRGPHWWSSGSVSPGR